MNEEKIFHRRECELEFIVVAHLGGDVGIRAEENKMKRNCEGKENFMKLTT